MRTHPGGEGEVPVIVHHEIARGHLLRELDLRHLRCREERLHLAPRQDRLGCQLSRTRRAYDSRHMIAVLVGDDDELRARQRAFHLPCRFHVIGFLDTATEKPMDLLVHPGVHHDVSIGVHHLEGRARLHARVGGSAFDREILRPAALRKFQHVDAERPSAGNQRRRGADVRQAGAPLRKPILRTRRRVAQEEASGEEGGDDLRCLTH